jgi:hypothetical protein
VENISSKQLATTACLPPVATIGHAVATIQPVCHMQQHLCNGSRAHAPHAAQTASDPAACGSINAAGHPQPQITPTSPDTAHMQVSNRLVTLHHIRLRQQVLQGSQPSASWCSRPEAPAGRLLKPLDLLRWLTHMHLGASRAWPILQEHCPNYAHQIAT